jgi:ADP-heptose:LPS heptosyltransferase
MGDVAMTVPVLRALSEQYPQLKITVLTKAFFKPLFNGLNNVEVYSADLKGNHKGILGLYKLAKELKRLKFEVVADLHNVLRSKILKFFFIGTKVVQIDKGRQEKKALVSGKELKQLKSTHQRYAEVFEKLGYKIDLSHPKFPSKPQLSKEITKLIKGNYPLIGIAPFAAHKGKMYPLDKMGKVIEHLSNNNQVFLFGGGENEIITLEDLSKKYTNVISIAGKLSFEEELNLISNLDTMLSMDSGNAHLAAMFGIKVLTIWGVTHPFAGFAPFNQPDSYMLLADREKYPLIPTSVYGNMYPENYEDCAGSISVKKIIEKVESTISTS